MAYDYSKLYGKIKEKCKTQEVLSKKIGISRTSLNQRLNNRLEFTQEEILKTIYILDLEQTDIPEYFFSLKVKKTEQNKKLKN